METDLLARKEPTDSQLATQRAYMICGEPAIHRQSSIWSVRATSSSWKRNSRLAVIGVIVLGTCEVIGPETRAVALLNEVEYDGPFENSAGATKVDPKGPSNCKPLQRD